MPNDSATGVGLESNKSPGFGIGVVRFRITEAKRPSAPVRGRSVDACDVDCETTHGDDE